jgi:hypothetical protein
MLLAGAAQYERSQLKEKCPRPVPYRRALRHSPRSMPIFLQSAWLGSSLPLITSRTCWLETPSAGPNASEKRETLTFTFALDNSMGL